MKKFFTVVMVAIIIIITSMTFTNNAFATSIPTTIITSVKAKDKAFTVKWKKKSDITGYQIQYSTNKKFNKKNSKKIQIKQAKTTSKKITGLKSSKKYYVRIRTYKLVKKKKSYSSWSKKKCITTKSSTPISAATTTAQTRCTNNNNHSMSCGNMGKWFTSKSDIDDYWEEVVQTYSKQYENGEITWETYCKKSPYGYECWSCSYCNKWTGNFKYR